MMARQEISIGGGGMSVSPGRFDILVPGQFRLKGLGGEAVDRAARLNSHWSGESYSHLIEITRIIRHVANEDNTRIVNRVFTRWARGAEHQDVVIAWIVKQMLAWNGVQPSEDREQASLGTLSAQHAPHGTGFLRHPSPKAAKRNSGCSPGCRGGQRRSAISRAGCGPNLSG